MTALVTKHLPLVSGAPDGIKTLRQLILELAVRGKLVTQIASDGKAEDLLDEIKKQLAVNFIASRGKKTSNGHFINDDEVPFNIPPSWRWTKISEITSYVQRGKGPVYAEKSEYPVISQKCVRWTGLDLGPARFIDPESIDKYEPVRRIVEGDILWNSTGTGTIGRACVVRKKDLKDILVADSHVTVVRCVGVLPDFLWRWIQTSTVQRQIESAASGSTNQIELNTSTVLSHFVPIPPLAEQNRIVAKVDELMALCDKLETDQVDAEAAHAQLVRALLDSLTQAKDAEDFQESWRRLSENFHTLFTTEASINALRYVILHLAADGRLVKSNEDRSAIFVAVDEVLAEKTMNGCSIKPSNDDSGTPILRISAGTGSDDFYVDESDHKWVEISGKEEKKFELQPEDLLACRFNGNMHYVGAFSLYRGESGKKLIFPDKLIRFRINRRIALPTFIRYVMNAFPARIQIESFCATTVGNIGISASNLRTVKIRLPSLAEQHRIVAKVDELMALCDQLKANLTDARQQHSQLASVLVEEVTA